MWSVDDSTGVFSVSSLADRRTLQQEEGRFVLGTILHDPLGVAAAAATNWVKLLGMVYAEAPLVDQRMYLGHPENYPAKLPQTNELYLPTLTSGLYRTTALPTVISRLGDCTNSEPACQPRLTMAAAAPLQIAEFLAACVAIAAITVRMVRRPSGDRLWLRALGLITFAILVNALLCGAIAGPFARYQSSVAWLAVMMAAVGGCSLLAGVGRRPVSASDRLTGTRTV